MLLLSISIGRYTIRGVPTLRATVLRPTSPAWRCCSMGIKTQPIVSKRNLSTTQLRKMSAKDIFPAVPASVAPQIQQTETVWKHEIFTGDEMAKVSIAHRDTQTMSDRVALRAVRLLRSAMDVATGYRHPDAISDRGKERTKAQANSQMTETRWLIRFIFLESVAGVPGMVGGMLRHLSSLRRLKRDNAWIETLIEESFNERMHLLTFLKLYSPWDIHADNDLRAQGVFFNAFFLSYVISPRTCHRFVGYLEEEAVITYTRALQDLDAGKLPLWQKLHAPEIAIQYWNMPEGYQMMRNLLLYVRADEAKHREVNHTLGNLDQKNDPNPFNSKFLDPTKPHPSKRLTGSKGVGWARDEAL